MRAIVGFVQHHNGVFPWSVSANGEVQKCDRLALLVGARGGDRRARVARRRSATSAAAPNPRRQVRQADQRRRHRGLEHRHPHPRRQGPAARHAARVAEGKTVYDAQVRRLSRRRREGRAGVRHDGRRHRLVQDQHARADARQHVSVRADPVRLHPPRDADGPPAVADATTRSTRCRRTSSTSTGSSRPTP